MKIIPVPVFADNYIWTIIKNNQAAIVDPGEAAPILAYLEAHQLELVAILLTHKHDDHVGGVAKIREIYPQVSCIGPVEVKKLVTECVQEKDSFQLFGQRVDVFKTAGHTAEHISYLMGKHLFCGDALFFAGCGRVFTKDYQAQYDALQFFKSLPEEVLVYVGHEYTERNLMFATIVLDNDIVGPVIAKVRALRMQDKPTLPSSIQIEKQVNPFLRAESIEEFIALRNKRDEF